MAGFPTTRLRRLRQNAALREMLAGVRLSRKELVSPLFVCEGSGIRRPVPSMPGVHQHSVDTAVQTVRRWADLGIPAVLLFGIADRKDAGGSGAWDDSAAVQRLTAQIKRELPGMLVMTDVCLCEYTDHGHCGPLVRLPDGSADVDNDAALGLLSRVAVSHARAGADVVAPSAMMDGQVSAIRVGLDEAGFSHLPIMSYSVKFASSFYGPFRDAAQSAPREGDRRSYQMDYRSPSQWALEAQADVDEGADIIMVKPAIHYLDVIARLSDRLDVPIGAYQVSGEYSAIKAASAAGWLDEKSAALEAATAVKRAGADLIITYYAEQLASWL